MSKKEAPHAKDILARNLSVIFGICAVLLAGGLLYNDAHIESRNVQDLYRSIAISASYQDISSNHFSDYIDFMPNPSYSEWNCAAYMVFHNGEEVLEEMNTLVNPNDAVETLQSFARVVPAACRYADIETLTP